MSDGMDFWRWREANPNGTHCEAYQAGYEAARRDVKRMRDALMKIQWIGYGPDQPSAQYQIDTANALAKEALHPLPAPPKEQG